MKLLERMNARLDRRLAQHLQAAKTMPAPVRQSKPLPAIYGHCACCSKYGTVPHGLHTTPCEKPLCGQSWVAS